MKQIDVDKIQELLGFTYYVFFRENIIPVKILSINMNESITVFVNEDKWHQLLGSNTTFDFNDLHDTPDEVKIAWLADKAEKETKLDEDIIKIKGE